MKYRVLISIGLIGVIFFLANRKDEQRQSIAETVTPKAKDLIHAKDHKLIKQLKKLSVGETNPDVCTYKMSLASSSVDELSRNLKSLDDYIDLNCLKADMGSVSKKILEKCAVFLEMHNDHSVDKDEDACLQSLIVYRARAIHEHSKLIEEPLSSSTIMNKIVALFSMDDLTDPKNALVLDEARTLARELSLLEPDLYAAQKAVVVTEMLQFFNGTRKMNEENLLRFQKQLEVASEFSIDDPEIFDAGIAPFVVLENIDKIEEMASDYSKQYPGQPAGYYYLAYVSWFNQDRESAESLLRQALRINPDNLRVGATFEKIKSAKLGAKGLFNLSLGVSFDDI